MQKLYIFGDSFATNTSSDSWTSRLHNNTVNYAINGASEYRILKQIKKYCHLITYDDVVIISHTNPYRIFVPDSVDYPSRKLDSHKFCDLVINDALSSSWKWNFITKAYFKYFFDPVYAKTIWDLLVSEEVKILPCPVISTSGFDINSVKNFYHISSVYKGNINHMTWHGNALVAEFIKEKLHDFV